jgi:hypothetical protein
MYGSVGSVPTAHLHSFIGKELNWNANDRQAIKKCLNIESESKEEQMSSWKIAPKGETHHKDKRAGYILRLAY